MKGFCMPSSQFPVMENMTVKQITEYVGRKQSIIIPIGVIEQHGYHLPLNTDAVIAYRIAQRIGAKADTLVAPVMYESFSGGGCPGTINISPATMSLVISDLLISLVSQGFRNLFLFLCHGGSENARALDDAIKILLRTNPAFDKVLVALLPIWDCDPDQIGYRKGFKEQDWHAGWLETSIMMAVAPELVRMYECELDKEPYKSLQRIHPDNYQCAEKIVDDKFVIPRFRQNPKIKVGVMGYPERASKEVGQQVIDTVVDFTSKKILELESKSDGVYKNIKFTPEPLIF